MKRILLILIVFLLVGCAKKNNFSYDGKVDYRLYIDDYYKENILFFLQKDASKVASSYNPLDDTGSEPLEYYLIKKDVYPIFSKNDVIYNKTLKKKSNYSLVDLSYNYIEKDFLNENFISSCFENWELNSYDDSFELHLYGNFYCNTRINNININIDTSREVVESNGKKSKDGYSWTIDKDNYENIDIYYKIARAYDNMLTTVSNNNNNIFKRVISSVILVTIVIVFAFLYIFYRRIRVNRLNNM